jgi:hypothetical protein
MIRRHNLLLPFLFTLLHNRPPAFDRDGVKTGVHTGIAARRGLGARGLISPAFARSRDAADYLRNALADAYRRPMICHIDCRGQFTAAARGETVTMETLRADGRATRANALLALSMDWNSAKIKTIPGTPYMRAEMRDMDTAGHHAASLAIINGLMNMDDECGRAVDSLLAGYGYAGAGPAFSTTLDRDLTRAERQAGSFMDMPYGGGRMGRFAQDFIATLAPYAARHGVAEDMGPLAHACETGMTEAKALDAILNTPQDVADFQRMYDTALLADPRTSLALRLR